MSSQTDSIASGGDIASSSGSMHHGIHSLTSTMLHIDVPLPLPLQSENDLLDDDYDEVEWELQNNGLYVGSYSRVLFLNAFVPLFVVIIFTVLALLPDLAWPIPNFPSQYPTSFPFPLPQVLLSSAFFSLAHLLRVPLYSLTSLVLPPDFACFASTLLHVLLTNTLRLAALVLLQVRHFMDYPLPTCQDPAFRTVWWLSLNFAEVFAAIIQGYQQLALYRNVMVPEGREVEFLQLLKAGSSPQLENNNAYFPEEVCEDEDGLQGGGGAQNVDSQINRGLEKLLVIRTRDEVEDVYGLPVIKIPVFISCLQRFNSIFLSVGLNLLLSAAYLRSPLSLPLSDHQVHTKSNVSSNASFFITLPLVLLLQASLAALHTPTVLPRLGVHTAAYIGVLVGIMSFFAGLAVWGALS